VQFRPICFCWLILVCSSFYVPGVAPRQYNDSEQVDLYVNKLTSVLTQLPYGYYSLKFCPPAQRSQAVENLGQILRGDIIERSPYDIKMNVNSSCQLLCSMDLTEAEKTRFREVIDEAYQVNWIVDNLPGATMLQEDQRYRTGFPVGLRVEPGTGSGPPLYYLHNHVRIHLRYHSDPSYTGKLIVGFEVTPLSYSSHVGSDGKPQCGSDGAYELSSPGPVVFTYDVVWTYSEVEWATRWDYYLKSGEVPVQIHWFSITTYLMLVLVLFGIVAVILARALRRDILYYNELSVEDAAEETGWKLVHADVFRRPPHARVLTVFVGTGAQLLGMAVVTILFAALGLLSPARRGVLLQAVLFLFTVMGGVGGFYHARFYKTLDGSDWKKGTLMTAFLFPGTCFAVFFVLNLFVWGEKSSGAVPFASLVALLLLWFGVSVPLVFVGAYCGYSKPAYEVPVKINPIPRQIPRQPSYMNPWLVCLFAGVMPFGAVYTELFFVMTSVWRHQFYYLFGFMIIELLILVVTCAEISISVVYFQLAVEDYRWWWRSFLASGSSAVYVFLYACSFFSSKLHIVQFVPTLMYFGYMSLVSFAFFLMTGAVGTIACFHFCRVIYGSIKVD